MTCGSIFSAARANTARTSWALLICRRFWTTNPKASDFDRGRISFYLGDYEQARASLEKAQEAGGAEAASLLGQTYEALGDYNYAASVYSTYLETKEPDASIYNQLGLCKLKAAIMRRRWRRFRRG